MAIQATLYDPDGTLVGDISLPVVGCDSSYRLYGGCDSATLIFQGTWSTAYVAARGQQIILKAAETPIFSGRVTDSRKSLDGRQTLQLDGWWKRLNELTILADPTADSITFGACGVTDHPEIATAYDLVYWILQNIVAPDTLSPISWSSSTLVRPDASTKLGRFCLYASDKLASVLETLATMDDCVAGIDSQSRFYYLGRTSQEASTFLTLKIAEAAAAGWQSSGEAFAVQAEAVNQGRVINEVSIVSRDVIRKPGRRTYILHEAATTARRPVSFFAPNVLAGPGARRLAAGLLKRLEVPATSWENLQCVSSTRRFEPHLGATVIRNSGSQVASGLAGTVSVNWIGATMINVTMGEQREDPGGSLIAATNPFLQPEKSRPIDEPQISIGSGAFASWRIDLDDGFNGDGDDLHTNPNRDCPSDPSGSGVDAVDYGTDAVNADNGDVGGPQGPTGPAGPAGASGGQWFHGSGAPSSGLGADGDYYTDTATGDVYSKASGSWSYAFNILGPQGETGPQGPQGDPGPTGATGAIGPTGATGPQGAMGPSNVNIGKIKTDKGGSPHLYDVDRYDWDGVTVVETLADLVVWNDQGMDLAVGTPVLLVYDPNNPTANPNVQV